MRKISCLLILFLFSCAPKGYRVVTYEDVEIAWKNGKCIESSILPGGLISTQEVKKSICKEAFKNYKEIK